VKKEVITQKQGIFLIIIYSIGTSIVIVTGVSAKIDLWVSIIIATIIIIPMGLIYAKLNSILPEKDLCDILEFSWGKVLGKIMISLYLLYIINTSFFVLRDIAEFFRLTVGSETPMIVPAMTLMFVSAFAVKNGIEVLARFVSFIFIPVVLFIILDNTLLLPNVDIENFKPFMYYGWKPVIKGVFNTIAFPIGEIVAFTAIFHTLKDKKVAKGTYIKGILATGIILLISSLISVLVIGPEVADIYYFPAYIATTRISIGNYLQSVEVILAFLFTIGCFVKFSILFLCASNLLTKLLAFDDYRFIVLPTGLLILSVARILFKSTSEFYYFTATIWPYYAIPFQIVFPIITLVLAETKLRKKKNQN